MLYHQFASKIAPYYRTDKMMVLALSGGLDSRVLLHLLCQYRQEHPDAKIRAVHVNHGISPNADDWVEQCRAWCVQGQIAFDVERVQLTLGPRVSLEQAARKQRYQALAKYIGPQSILLTAQHASDQLETFLLALKRGSGPKGLSAMPAHAPFSEGALGRPLLQVSQSSIYQYACAHELRWIEDESNQDTQYDRNFLRRQVLPILSDRWPQLEKTVARSASLCAEQEALLDELLTARLAEATASDGSLQIEVLRVQSELARNQLLRMWLEAQHCIMPSRKQLSAIWQEVALARQDANPRVIFASGQIRRYQQRLYLLTPMQDLVKWSAPLTFEQPLVLPDQLGQITLWRAVEQSNQQLLRAPTAMEAVRVMFDHTGITAHPAGRQHSRKLKKLFQEYGVPSWQRGRLPLVMYGERLAMVAGLFVDQAFVGEDCAVQWDIPK